MRSVSLGGKLFRFEESEWLTLCAFIELCSRWLKEEEFLPTFLPDDIDAMVDGTAVIEMNPQRMAHFGGFAEGALIANLDMRMPELVYTDGVHLMFSSEDFYHDVTVEKALEFTKALFGSHIMVVEEAKQYARIRADTDREEVLGRRE